MSEERDPRPLDHALARILRPLVRLLLARGIRHQVLSDRLKALYVAVAERDFRIEGRRVTDSRLSLLTGLQRKDIRTIRARPPASAAEEGAGPLPRVLARWQARGASPLPRSGAGSFEALVGEISSDIHPRTVLDELVRLGLATVDDDEVRLSADAFLPGRDDAALLGYLGANLGDHAEAAAANVLAAPEAGPFFERAVHYNRLAPSSLDELEALARRLQGEALGEINRRAEALQARDMDRVDATGRFRCGAFVYRETEPEEDAP